MAQPEMSPMPSGPRRELGGRQMSADDIALPPIPQPVAETSPISAGVTHHSPAAPRRSSRFSQLWMATGLVAALAMGMWLWRSNHSVETAHPNWNHVAAAADASAHGANVVIQRTSAGATRGTSTVELSMADADEATTQAVRELLLKNDLAGANATLQAAQAAAIVQTEGQQPVPVLGPNARLVNAIRDGSAKFFHLRLFDCCDEDGDIVDISLDGKPFSRVPLTHKGTIISLPMTPGTTVVTLRGVRDGGGCITVSFQTSQGDYFSQPLDVGEECHFGVVVK